MADGNLTYQFSIEGLERAAARLREAAGRAAETGNKLDDAARAGRAAAAAVGGIEAAPIDAAANAADRLGDNLKKVGDKAKISAERLMGIGAVAAGMAIDVGGSYMESTGQDRAAGYMRSIGGGAVQMAQAMAPLGGQAMLVGAAVGAVAGAATQFFGEKTAERKAAEALAKSVALIGIESEQAQRSLERIEVPQQLEAEIQRLRDGLEVLADKAGAELVDPGIADAASAAMREQLALAERLLPIRTRSAEQAAAEADAAKRLAEQTRAADQAAEAAARQAAAAASKAAADQERDVAKARDSINSTMAAAGDPQADSLASKGWGGVGASVTAGLEALTRDGNGLLREISQGITRIATTAPAPAQAVYA